MGIDPISWVFLGVMALSAIFAYSSMKGANTNPSDMEPAGMDSFQVTQAREGSCVPLVYGRVRIPGNILWYGNLVTEAIIQEVEGGKGGGGSEDVVSGYKYYMDVWQAIGMGKLSIVKTFIHDEDQIPSAQNTIFNDGTQSTYPTEPGVFATKLKGVSHVFYKKWHLGDNTTNVPTIHFVVERVLQTGISYQNLSNGSNPSAIIYDLLLKAGIQHSEIDTSSFNTAAAYWNSQGYGLNLIFNRQEHVARMIEKVLQYVDGLLYINRSGKFSLKAYDPAEASADVMNEDDFIDFSFTRSSYEETFNDFRGTFTDESQNFSQRAVVIQNPASIQLLGYKRQASVDLNAFRDASTASRRLTEVMKRQSYPAASIDFKTNLRFSHLERGVKITVSHSDYGIVSMDFRIMTVDYTNIDREEISFQAVQVVETIHDDVFQDVGGSSWSPPDKTVQNLYKVKIFEMPYNSTTGKDPAYLLLTAREKGMEVGFELLFSNTGADYVSMGTFTTWSQAGTLGEDYPATTFNVDDDRGILYTPYRDDPAFGTISRAELFSRMRVAIVGNEMMAFQAVTPEGPSSYRLKGVLRGLLNTPIENHYQNDQIFITNLGDNILQGVTASSFFLKLLPYFSNKKLDAGSATAHSASLLNKASTPWPVARIKAVRSGSTVDIEWWPKTQDNTGAGAQSADAYADQYPFPFQGDFQGQKNSDPVSYETVHTKQVIEANAFSLKVRHRVNGKLSPVVTLTVGTSDGEYTV